MKIRGDYVYKKIFSTFLVVLIFTSCGSVKEAAVIYNKPIESGQGIAEATTVAAPTETPAPVVHNVKMTVVGDLMVHEPQLISAYDKQTDTYDFNHSFEYVKKYLKDSDITVGNLETTIIGGTEFSTYPRFNSPVSFIEALKNAGFDMVTTANNHCNDKGYEGIISTLDALDSFSIEHFGTYRTKEERDTIFIKEVNNIKFAFLSYTYGTNGLPLPDGKDYSANIMSEQLIVSDIQRAKEFSPDFIIIMPHMGNEYEDYPKKVFTDWIDLMIKAGADIVLASHPHVLQPMEYRTVACDDGSEKTALVAYSLANFISSQRTIPREAGMILELAFEKTDDEKAVLMDVSYIPTWVQYKDTSGSYNVRVLPIYDVLVNGMTEGIRAKDIERMKNVHSESNFTVSGKKIPLEEIKERYYFLSGSVKTIK